MEDRESPYGPGFRCLRPQEQIAFAGTPKALRGIGIRRGDEMQRSTRDGGDALDAAMGKCVASKPALYALVEPCTAFSFFFSTLFPTAECFRLQTLYAGDRTVAIDGQRFEK